MDARTVESIVERIDGVKAVKVVDDGSTIREIHVVTDGSKNPKQVVRDIETAVFALTGLKIDRKIVSVAQVDSAGRRRKLGLSHISIAEDGLNAIVSVVITVDGEIFESEVSGPRTKRNLKRLVGEAVIRAVPLDEYAISLNDISIARLNNEDYVLTHLSCFDGKNEWDLIGVYPLSDDVHKSTALSVMDALEKLI